MFQILKAGIVCAVMTISFAGFAEGQTPVDPPVAPVPEQLLSAKRVFVSNATGEGVSPQGVSDLTYNEFYEYLKNWGAYQLVSSPADADLVLQIRYVTAVGTVSVFNGNGGSGQYEAFTLTIRDPKTQTVLWAFTRGIPAAQRQSTGRKNFDQTLSAIVEDFKKLVASPAPSGESTKK